MKRRKKFWTKERIIADAKKYHSPEEWNKHSPSARSIASRMGVYLEATAHMTRIAKPGFWTDERILEAAKKYQSRTRFQNACPTAYRKAWERGILDSVCAHMSPQETSDKLEINRILYKLSFSDNSVYVGITINLMSRLAAHLKTASGTVSDRSTSLGGEVPKQEIVAQNLSARQAQAAEKILIDELTSRGFVVLNRAAAGSLGARSRYVDEELFAIAKMYQTRSDFFKKEPGAYDAARCRGLLDQVCDHMRKPKQWTLATAAAVGKKYRNRNEWAHKDASSYNFVERAGKLDEVMPKKVKSWNSVEEAMDEGRKYKTRTEWQRQSGYSYLIVKRAGRLNEVLPSKHEVWDAEKVLIEKAKYRTTREWAMNSSGSYHFYLNHMKNKDSTSPKKTEEKSRTRKSVTSMKRPSKDRKWS